MKFFTAHNISVGLLLTSLLLTPSAEAKDGATAAKPIPVFKYREYEFRMYQTGDKFGRKITFFVSQPTQKKPLPIVLFINGAGGQSAFQKTPEGIVGDFPYDKFLKVMGNRARLMIVEKPGAQLFSPRAKNPEEFLKEYTLDRWTEANNAAVSALRSSPEIDKSKLLVIGHSDGGQVATHLARSNSAVTHVASLAGGGTTQLFDMAYSASGREQQNQNSSAEVERVYQKWQKIKEDPHSITKTAWGHPFNRWSSFLASSSLDDLLHCKTKAYLVQGTADQTVPVTSFDAMRAELVSHGRDAVFERIDGANHGLTIGTGSAAKEELPNILSRIMNWYLGKQ
ncbi:MAG: prolyl oligopeptidase family serine peptidase [Candidatus Obscuribacterales bacterium]|nr:prolyl oligopeptidase family serine peptidase [Candidatus Obscuribacterales bacterium]